LILNLLMNLLKHFLMILLTILLNPERATVVSRDQARYSRGLKNIKPAPRIFLPLARPFHGVFEGLEKCV
jgi:hypothetical protein